jgi:hypothetical protein
MLVFLNVDYASNSVIYAGYSPPWQDNHNAYTTILDDTHAGVKDLISNVSSHTFDSIIGTTPYIKANYDGANINVNVINGTASTVTLSILGNTYTATVINGTVAFPIAVHPSVSSARIPVSILVDGFPHTSIEIGGSNGNTSVQMYQDVNGIYNVVPANSTDLANYHTAKSMDTNWMIPDLGTITGLNAHVLFHYVLPALNLQLTADEQNGLSDIKTNILPSIVSTLANIAPVGHENDIHYASYKYHIAQAKTAMDSYTNDRNEIMKYTTLK